MSNNYFDFLEQNAQQDKPANDAPQNDGTVNLTVRADAECQVVCDGDFLFLLNANQIVKETAPVGQHILQFISIDHPDICIEKIVDFPEAGKNYLVIVNEFMALITDFQKKEAERKAKEEAERIVTMAFTAKQGAKGTYTGHVKDGKPEGKGRVVFESGGVYEGDFHNGWRHGKGYDKSSDGDIYEGDFSEDTRTGKGKLSKPDGRVWEGEFLNGESHGKTKLYYPNGNTLEGIWENGHVANKPNVYTWANGDRLECEGWDGGSHGKGVYYWKDGRKKEEIWSHGEEAERIVTMAFTAKQGAKGTYTGHVKDGKPEGKGKVVFESGGVYEGDFHNGWRHGRGYNKISNGDIYEGDFLEDMRTGKGKLSKPDGRVWEGEFLNGISHGKTKCYYTNGDTSEGIWENGAIANKPNVYTWANGDRLECEGWDGGSHGKGVYYWKDGRKKEEIWSHGKRVKEVNGHEYVDLGLSVKWATCNVGASSPSDYGSYFAWGETTPKSEYTWGNLRYCADNNGDSFTKYNTQSKYGNVDNKTRLEPGDDAARANWGGSWRIPTDAEWTELREKCTWKWTNQGGKNGCKVTSKINGNSIFLPAAGRRKEIFLTNKDSFSYYWSSSLSTDHPYDAWDVSSEFDVVGRYRNFRYYGYSIRPVTE